MGCLFIQRDVALFPLLHGGGHEFSKRAGTANTPLIVGFATAVLMAAKEFDFEKLLQQSKYFLEMLKQKVKGQVKINGIPLENAVPSARLPHILNLSFPDAPLQADQAVRQLSRRSIWTSTASACSNEKDDILQVSHVLTAIGISQKVAAKSIRISLSKFTTKEELEHATDAFSEIFQNG